MQRCIWPATAMAAALMSVLCACTGAPALQPTPSPTYVCVPEKGGEAVPCGPIEFEQAQKRDARYNEAEAVFRRFWAEQNKQSAMDNPEFTSVMGETTSGLFEEDVRTALTPGVFRKRIEGEVRLVRVERLLGYSRSGSTLTMRFCADARGAKFENPESGETEAGRAYEERIYFAPIDGTLKLVDADMKRVESC